MFYPNGHQIKVPVYEVNGCNGFNQIIGYAKYINKGKQILYRGETGLHGAMLPSLYRKDKSQRGQSNSFKQLSDYISSALKHPRFAKITGMSAFSAEWKKRVALEALLQHYGVPTRCIDVVDNHWISLWFGLYKLYQEKKKSGLYWIYLSRDLRKEITRTEDSCDGCMYQYVVLFAISRVVNFAKIKNEPKIMYAVDLRTILPSVFLRPHAQHGWVIRKGKIPPYDEVGMASNIICILKIHVAHAREWLGSGQLLSVDNLFPSPTIDQGYDILLSYEGLFGKNKIARYVC